jgi:threonine dehydratase
MTTASDVAPSPLQQAPADLAQGRELLLKREDLHELGAFKWRGALPVLRAFRERGADRVVTTSTGNHGAATAWAAARLGMQATVYVPRGAAAAKTALIERHGAELRVHGSDLDESKAAAVLAAQRAGAPFFEDGAEPAQYAGYESIGRELIEQLDAAPAAVLVPVGNGALLAGLGRALRPAWPSTLRVGVVASAAPVMAASWEARTPVEGLSSATCADGLAVRVAIPLAVEALRDAADGMLQVSERAIAVAMGHAARADLRIEPSAAAGLAALAQLDVDGPVVVVVTGRNVDPGLWRRALEEPESFPA